MHRLVFGHSFAELVAQILLLGLAFYFLNKKKASVHGNPEDADSGRSGSVIVPTGANSGGSSSSPTETVNGSSSSSTATTTGNSYDVFLSFRGPDTRNGFAGHLYNRLRFAKTYPFRDDVELRQGEKIRPDLLAAIKNSKILIPILSENYGTTCWCLDELVQIMECKKNDPETVVLPIFYKVAPADVRRQTGKFGEAFRDRKTRLRERNFDPTILKKWEDALKEVGGLRGREVNGSEAAVIDSVVDQVLLELKKKFELDIPEDLIGIDSHVKKLMEVINNNSGAILFVVIHGMGGIGKTTLAKKIYNELSNRFKYCCFIPDVRESCKRNGIEHLQNKLISVTLERDHKVSTRDEGIRFLSSNIKDKKVLILLDDVDKDDDLKALAGKRCWFSSESIIIITTRNMGIIDEAGRDYPYELERMDRDNSTILFSRHAFLMDSPPSELKELTDKVVSTTGGLPLALKVLGSLLHGAQRNRWTRMIKKLQKIPDEEVQGKLKISYDALSFGQKQIFLDIACFFIGTDERVASYMWDACNFFAAEIEVLRLRSLIKVGYNHDLIMHDQLRDLGRWIVREGNENAPQYCSRLWNSKEAWKVLKEKEGTSKIEAISLSEDSSKYRDVATHQGDIILTGKQFKKLTNLRFLDATGAHFSGDFKNTTKKLKWLRWQNCPSTFEANNFHAKELVVLDLSRSNLSDGWQGWSSIKMAEKLQYLDLKNCRSLEKTFFLSAFKNLEVLILAFCVGIEQIDSSIGNMKSLQHLDLTRCMSLKGLPAEVGKLEALEQLILRHCDHLSSLPDSIGALQNLEILDISHTGIKELPDGIGRLRKLRDLRASCCSQLGGVIPKGICNISSLQRLNFGSCGNLQSLPVLPSSLTFLHVTCRSRRLSSLSNLTHLKEVRIHLCEFLECIWEQPSTQLEILAISSCNLMKTLDVLQFNHLRTLSVRYCKNILEIRGLDELLYLESFEITGCPSIKRLDLPKSKSLKKLIVEYCKNLVEIQGLDTLESLEEIDISECASIERLDLSKSKGLMIFHAIDCERLVEIQGLNTLESLKEIDICECTSIERLNLSKSNGLKIFKAIYCKSLVEIQGLDTLESLEEIDISECVSIERLNLPKSKVLKKLFVGSCEKLSEIQGLDGLEFLKVLNLSGCTSFGRLPNICCFDTLQKLAINCCDNLHDIQGLVRFPSCTSLWIEDCNSLANFPNLSNFRNLKKLYLSNCHGFREIPWLVESTSLFYIAISGFSSVEIFPDLSSCTNLSTLVVRNCEKLTELQGLEKLEHLRILDISGCKSLKTIPELPGILLYQNYKQKPFDLYRLMREFGEDDSVESEC
ncbi:disease resistance protein L6-like [Rhodamnia argentea]|uniref:Disease resistance protein L6-like n=1 Tax=Rhodamnia argentea TaxID=178133 RepID=A0ABM3HBT7_9MYRT|nr:disease resistance protein L6-like [Rhodamnia argentea]